MTIASNMLKPSKTARSIWVELPCSIATLKFSSAPFVFSSEISLTKAVTVAMVSWYCLELITLYADKAGSLPCAAAKTESTPA